MSSGFSAISTAFFRLLPALPGAPPPFRCFPFAMSFASVRRLLGGRVGGLAGAWRGGCARLLPALGEACGVELICRPHSRYGTVRRYGWRWIRPAAPFTKRPHTITGGPWRRWRRRRRRWLATWRLGPCGGRRFPLWRRGRLRPARESGRRSWRGSPG